jgi:exosortase
MRLEKLEKMIVNKQTDGIVKWVVGSAIIALLFSLYGLTGNPEEVAVLGRSAIHWVIGRWNWAGADMSHGWVIPLVSGWLIWRRRAELKSVPKSGSGLGLIIIVGAMILYLLGIRVQQTRLVLTSLPLLLLGIPWFLFGNAVGRILVFPSLYLVFCIPFTFLDSLTFPLRLISTSVSCEVLNGLGIHVTRVGTAINIHAGAGFSLDVAHPCSGLRYLIAMVALTTAYAYVTQKVTWRKWGLSLASVPLAMAGNMVRIILIAVVGVIWGQDVAVGFYHDYSGYVVFAVAIILMIGLGNLMEGRPPSVGKGVS